MKGIGGKGDKKAEKDSGECMCNCICVLSPSVHQNYVGTDAEKNPFYLSVVLSDQNNQRVPQYRAILWRKTVSSTHAQVLTSFTYIKVTIRQCKKIPLQVWMHRLTDNLVDSCCPWCLKK